MGRLIRPTIVAIPSISECPIINPSAEIAPRTRGARSGVAIAKKCPEAEGLRTATLVWTIAVAH